MTGGDIFKKRRIVVLGSRCTGKSSLVAQYVLSQFVEEYYPTIENTHTMTIKYAGAEFDCDIIDTAGQDEFSILNAKHVIGIHGYVLVYSVTSIQSFDMVKILYDKIIEFSGLSRVPAVIVGQKADVAFPAVCRDKAQDLASQLGCPFIETSARSNLSVDKAFELCLEEIEKIRCRRQGVPAQPALRCILM